MITNFGLVVYVYVASHHGIRCLLDFVRAIVYSLSYALLRPPAIYSSFLLKYPRFVT